VIDVDPESVRRALKCKNFSSALIQSLQLNDRCLFNEVVEKIPLSELDPIVIGLDIGYVKRVLDFMSYSLSNTRHIEYYLLWLKLILYRHGLKLKNLPANETTPIVRSLHQGCYRVLLDLKQNCDFCKYSLEYLLKDESLPFTTENK